MMSLSLCMVFYCPSMSVSVCVCVWRGLGQVNSLRQPTSPRANLAHQLASALLNEATCTNDLVKLINE